MDASSDTCGGEAIGSVNSVVDLCGGEEGGGGGGGGGGKCGGIEDVDGSTDYLDGVYDVYGYSYDLDGVG